MRARFARIAARTQKIVEGHLNESMEDIHQNLDKIEKEIANVRPVLEAPDAGVELLVDTFGPALDYIEACVRNIKEAK